MDLEPIIKSMAPAKALALLGYGESVASYRYRTLADKAPSQRLKSVFEEMADEEREVRYGAVHALGNLGRDAVPILLEAITDDDLSIRRRACLSLGEVGPGATGATDALVAALNDSDIAVQWAAAQALGSVDPDPGLAVPALIEALGADNALLQQYAADALEAITGQAFGADAGAWRNWWAAQ